MFRVKSFTLWYVVLFVAFHSAFVQITLYTSIYRTYGNLCTTRSPRLIVHIVLEAVPLFFVFTCCTIKSRNALRRLVTRVRLNFDFDEGVEWLFTLREPMRVTLAANEQSNSHKDCYDGTDDCRYYTTAQRTVSSDSPFS